MKRLNRVLAFLPSPSWILGIVFVGYAISGLDTPNRLLAIAGIMIIIGSD